MSKYYWTIIGIFITQLTFAQVEDKKFGEGHIIPVPAQKKDSLIKVDSTNIKKIEQSNDSLANKGEGQASIGQFTPFLEESIPQRNPLEKTLGELQVVQVSEELRIDCVWVKAADYYAIWDSKNVNPYGKDASIFRDTIDIELYNTSRGELWASPLDVTLQTSAFGFRWGRFHHGVDLNLRVGTPIFSVFDGIVRISGYDRGFGHYVVMRHKNGLETLYGHMSSRKVSVGQVIKAGQLIGLGGSTGWSTGPHLHFEVRYEGNSFNPLLIYDFSKESQLIANRFSLMPKHFAHLGNRVRKSISHKVEAGETLSIISAKYNVSVMTLARLNKISVNSILKVGQILIIK